MSVQGRLSSQMLFLKSRRSLESHFYVFLLVSIAFLGMPSSLHYCHSVMESHMHISLVSKDRNTTKLYRSASCHLNFVLAGRTKLLRRRWGALATHNLVALRQLNLKGCLNHPSRAPAGEAAVAEPGTHLLLEATGGGVRAGFDDVPLPGHKQGGVSGADRERGLSAVVPRPAAAWPAAAAAVAGSREHGWRLPELHEAGRRRGMTEARSSRNGSHVRDEGAGSSGKCNIGWQWQQ